MLPCYGQKQARAEQPSQTGELVTQNEGAMANPQFRGRLVPKQPLDSNRKGALQIPRTTRCREQTAGNNWQLFGSLFGFCLSHFVRLSRCLGLLLALPADACDIADGKKDLPLVWPFQSSALMIFSSFKCAGSQTI